jgi:hypothetical protein
MAISKIDQTRADLADHIHKRILEAQSTPYKNDNLSEMISLRCDLADQLKVLESKNPKLDINLYQSVMTQIGKTVVLSLSKELVPVVVLKRFIDFLISEERRLDQVSGSSLTVKPAVILKTTLDDRQKEQLKSNLATLTQNPGWKINPNNHLECWIELSNPQDAQSIAKVLQEARIGNTTVLQRSDTKVPVVKCSNINLKTLKEKIDKVNTELNSLNLNII